MESGDYMRKFYDSTMLALEQVKIYKIDKLFIHSQWGQKYYRFDFGLLGYNELNTSNL